MRLNTLRKNGTDDQLLWAYEEAFRKALDLIAEKKPRSQAHRSLRPPLDLKRIVRFAYPLAAPMQSRARLAYLRALAKQADAAGVGRG